jgi:hypothetical protein
VTQTEIQFRENIYFNVWFNVIISVGGGGKRTVEELVVEPGTLQGLMGASDSINVCPTSTYVKLCICAFAQQKET